jgi:hypothetical protein
MKEINIEYSYPLSNSVIFSFITNNQLGFTRAELAKKICDCYKQIYDAEDAVGYPGHIPGMLNRNESNGQYGIWGHDIGDLLLHSVYQVNDNLFKLGVDS